MGFLEELRELSVSLFCSEAASAAPFLSIFHSGKFEFASRVRPPLSSPGFPSLGQVSGRGR